MCRWLVFNKSSVLSKEHADTLRPIGRLRTLSFKRAINKETCGTQVSSGITIVLIETVVYDKCLPFAFTLNLFRYDCIYKSIATRVNIVFKEEQVRVCTLKF